MLDRTERLTVALTVIFVGTLAATVYADSPAVWLGWATAMVLLAGSALVLANRAEPPPED
ncbi:hypothetical protein [Natronorubrum sulfidifaciens]|uniref:Uncharacterized protein n=1 Tax=Natronorubrum sulfidifaciens JCM 14089 TaxID=1230460 RepID=L9VZJ7_9EURY|nr:hypothetical protein [Natronorubrum sulfidifaciens]ELY42487.1 hypothetical protein C495_14267 [Natronorubrum sulfidifaciens JCM 14089]